MFSLSLSDLYLLIFLVQLLCTHLVRIVVAWRKVHLPGAVQRCLFFFFFASKVSLTKEIKKERENIQKRVSKFQRTREMNDIEINRGREYKKRHKEMKRYKEISREREREREYKRFFNRF